MAVLECDYMQLGSCLADFPDIVTYNYFHGDVRWLSSCDMCSKNYLSNVKLICPLCDYINYFLSCNR